MTNRMPETVYVREESELGGTLRSWIVSESEVKHPLAVYKLVRVHPDFDQPQPEADLFVLLDRASRRIAEMKAAINKARMLMLGDPSVNASDKLECASYALDEVNVTAEPEAEADTKRIDFLESMLAKKQYTGRACLRWSTTGRGMRLHETTGNGKPTIREAIDDYIRRHEGGES